MSVGVMKDYKLKRRNLRASHTLEGCTPTSTTSTFRKCNGSYIHIQKIRSFIGKEKSICTTLPAVFEPRPDNVGCCPHAEAQHGLGGARNMTVSAAGSDSIMSQHIHMLTPGLPVFCSAAPTLVPMKVRSTW